MLSVGITEDLQISGSLPITLDSGIYMPRGRVMAMMSSNQDLEAIVGLALPASRGRRRRAARVHGLCRRNGALAAIPVRRHAAAPSVHVSAASGYASRTHYLWVGGGFQRFGEHEGDQMGDSIFYSAVYGYRPPFLRLDYPKPDLRFLSRPSASTPRGDNITASRWS